MSNLESALQTRIIVPAPKTSEYGEYPAAADILKLPGFTVSTPSKVKDKSKVVSVTIYNSLTNRRGSDASLVTYFAKAAQLAQQQGLDETLHFRFKLSGPEIKRKHSKLPDESYKKDRNYLKAFHKNSLPKKFKIGFYSGWEPEREDNPTDIKNDVRAGQLRKAINYAKENNIFTVLSCRAAHLALVDLLDEHDLTIGEPIQKLAVKLKSVAHAVAINPEHPLLQGLKNDIYMPVSRICAFNQAAMNLLIEKGIVQEIATSEEAGTLIAAKDNFVFISGHVECNENDIIKEDERDTDRDNKAGKEGEDRLPPTKNLAEHGKDAERDGLQIGANIIRLALAHAAAHNKTGLINSSAQEQANSNDFGHTPEVVMV